jgi:hypothetical protein
VPNNALERTRFARRSSRVLDGSTQMKRFAAKFLFDWYPDPVTGHRFKRLFEERIVVFNAKSANTALTAAKRLGQRSELRYESGHRLRFVGLMQLMELGAECEKGEVWWEFRRRRMTIGRARVRLVPAKRALYVFTDGQQSATARRGPSRRGQHAASRLTNRSSRRPRRPRLSG